MPPVIGAIGAAVKAVTVWYGGLGALGKLGVTLALSAGASVASAALMRSELKGHAQGIRARDLASTAPLQAWLVAYGEPLVAGQVLYQNVHTINADDGPFDYDLLMAHVAHECERIQEVWYDADRLRIGASGNEINRTTGEVVSGKYRPSGANFAAHVTWNMGWPTQDALPALVDRYAEWTANHRARGHMITLHRFRLAENTDELWGGGRPQNIRVLLQGRKCYDPRRDPDVSGYSGDNPHSLTNESTWQWTRNPILHGANYLMKYWGRYSAGGGGLATSRIEWDHAADEANICDAMVAVPGGKEPRYAGDGVISLGATNRVNMQAILSACMGECIQSGGKYWLNAGRYRAAPAGALGTITEDMILREPAPVWVPSAERGRRYNGVSAVYRSQERGWEDTESSRIVSAAFKARDGGRDLRKTIRLPFVRAENQAQRLSHKFLLQSDRQGVFTCALNWAGIYFRIGQGVRVTYSPRGWTNKTFIVEDLEVQGRSAPAVAVLREDDANGWADLAAASYVAASAPGAIATDGVARLPWRTIEAGRGIKSITRDPDTGVVTVTYTDGKTDTFTITEPSDAVGIKKIARDSATGVVTVTFTDNTTSSFTIPDGNGIKTIARDSATGVVTVTYDDGTTDTFTIADGAAGGTSEWIYRATNSNNTPATPTTTDEQDGTLDYVPDGWSDDPVSGNFTWVSKRTRAVGAAKFGKFSVPAPFRGRRGARGAPGVAGATWHQVSAAPANELGKDGDFAIVITGAARGDVYRKASGAWAKQGTLKGADGGVWLTGSAAPANADGNEGDWYFRTGTGSTAAEIYRKGTTAWVKQVDIDQGTPGEDGATWLTGSGAPANADGKVGDFYFRQSNGFVYEKTAATTWTQRADITGPQGKGIKDITRDDATGEMTVTFTDNTTATFTVADGLGIKDISRDDATGVVTVTYTDDTTRTFNVKDGAPGGTSEWIYRATNTNTRPATPTTTDEQDKTPDFVPAGWSDNPVEGTYVWVSKRTRSGATT